MDRYLFASDTLPMENLDPHAVPRREVFSPGNVYA